MLTAPEAVLVRLGASRVRPSIPYGFMICKAADSGALLYWPVIGAATHHACDRRTVR